jgi:hypothetical protein
MSFAQHEQFWKQEQACRRRTRDSARIVDEDHLWDFDLDDPSLDRARFAMRAFFRDRGHDAHEALAIMRGPADNYGDLAHVLVRPAALGVYCPEGEREPVDPGLEHCSACDSWHNGVEVRPQLRRGRMRKAVLAHFTAPLKLYCRRAFVDACEAHGLTGLQCELLDEEEDAAPDDCLYRVTVEMHRWNQRDGVCPRCETKTNIMGTSFFTLQEDYRFDFQFTRTHGTSLRYDGILTAETTYVLSRRALELLSTWKALEIHATQSCYPILPGYLREWICPEPRLFRGPEDWPAQILRPRAQWPKRPIPTPEEWLREHGPLPLPTVRPESQRATPPPKKARRLPPARITPALLTQAAAKLRHRFEPASANDVARLRKVGWPEKLVAFYAAHEPHPRRGAGALRLMPVRRIFESIEHLDPAAALAPLGYAPLASNEFGDMYVYDLKKVGPAGYPEVVFADHERFCGEVCEEDARVDLTPVARHLPEFLAMAAAGELTE